MRLTMPPLSLLPLLSLTAIACAGPSKGPVSFPAIYAPSGNLTALPSCAAASKIDVADGRKSKSIVVGRRFEEGAPNVDYPIQMEGELAPQLRSGLERIFKRSVANDDSSQELDFTLRELFLEEKVFRNAEYDGRLALEAVVKAPGSSKTCWKGEVVGLGENYGKAGNPENYQQTIGRALDAAVAELVKAPGFSDALCGTCK